MDMHCMALVFKDNNFDTIALVANKKSEKTGKHSGIGLPGGKAKDNEAINEKNPPTSDFVLRREIQEELGIQKIAILGKPVIDNLLESKLSNSQFYRQIVYICLAMDSGHIDPPSKQKDKIYDWGWYKLADIFDSQQWLKIGCAPEMKLYYSHFHIIQKIKESDILEEWKNKIHELNGDFAQKKEKEIDPEYQLGKEWEDFLGIDPKNRVCS